MVNVATALYMLFELIIINLSILLIDFNDSRKYADVLTKLGVKRAEKASIWLRKQAFSGPSCLTTCDLCHFKKGLMPYA